jgi:DNA invertase Pin-like site-specific DNA recombinase
MERLAEVRAGFRGLTEAIDTTTLAGRMMMQMVGAFAEFERAMPRERTKAGLESARGEGRIRGRRPKLSAEQRTEIARMVFRGDKTAADAARLFRVHPATIAPIIPSAGHGQRKPRGGSLDSERVRQIALKDLRHLILKLTV